MLLFNNKSNYDPGRFRHEISFFQETALENPYGGTSVSDQAVKTLRAVKLPVRDNDQLMINAGLSSFKEDVVFVIRNTLFVPVKNMTIVEGGRKYTLRGVVPVDNPVKYFKLLCSYEN